MDADMKLRKGVSKDESLINSYLAKGEVMHLALEDKMGLFSVPVNYGYYNGKIYIHSSKKGRKIEALHKGGVIGFSVLVEHQVVAKDDPCKWGCAFKSVIGAGVPRVLEEKEKLAALNCIMKQYSGKEWTMSESGMKAVDVVEIMVTSISARTVEKD